MPRIEWIKDCVPATRGRFFVKFRDEHGRIRVATAIWNGKTFTCGSAPEGTPVIAWRPIPGEVYRGV